MTDAAANTLAEQMAGTTFTVAAPAYTVLSAANLDCLADPACRDNCFAVLHDPDLGEYTVIVEDAVGCAVEIRAGTKRYPGYRLIRFNLLLPFEGVGFIATLTRAVADRGANLLAISGYSCDYLMVADDDLDQAVLALRGLGLKQR